MHVGENSSSWSNAREWSPRSDGHFCPEDRERQPRPKEPAGDAPQSLRSVFGLTAAIRAPAATLSTPSRHTSPDDLCGAGTYKGGWSENPPSLPTVDTPTTAVIAITGDVVLETGAGGLFTKDAIMLCTGSAGEFRGGRHDRRGHRRVDGRNRHAASNRPLRPPAFRETTSARSARPRWQACDIRCT
jgi:hypothetical protein